MSEPEHPVPPSHEAQEKALSLPELLTNIFIFLPYRTASAAELVCKSWNETIKRSLKIKATRKFLKPASAEIAWTIEPTTDGISWSPRAITNRIVLTGSVETGVEYVLEAALNRSVLKQINNERNFIPWPCKLHYTYHAEIHEGRIQPLFYSSKGSPYDNMYLTQPPAQRVTISVNAYASSRREYYATRGHTTLERKDGVMVKHIRALVRSRLMRVMRQPLTRVKLTFPSMSKHGGLVFLSEAERAGARKYHLDNSEKKPSSMDTAGSRSML